MIQVEVFIEDTEQELSENINYFLSKLEEHLFIDLKYAIINATDDQIRYSAIVLYRV